MKKPTPTSSLLPGAATFLLRLRVRNTLLAATMLMVFAGGSVFAGSATWLTSPFNGIWNSAPNWSPMTVPNGPADTATFESSSISDISISADTEVNGIVFNPGARPHFTITATPNTTLSISGAGITNNSGINQNFVTAVQGADFGVISFKNNATVGSLTVLNNNGGGAFTGIEHAGLTEFNATSTAGSATINNNSGKPFGGQTVFNDSSSAAGATINNIGGKVSFARGGATIFENTSTAGNAMINNQHATGFDASDGFTAFFDTSTAGRATIDNEGQTVFTANGGLTRFFDSSTAGSATITNNGSAAAFAGGGEGSVTLFQGTSSADSATIINNGGTGNGAGGGTVGFQGGSAGNATIINNGGTVSDARGGVTSFDITSSTSPRSSAGSATLIANGGTGGGEGGRIVFSYNSTGGTARVEVFGNGNLDISFHDPPGMTIGSIEGTGQVFLGANNLTVGNNGLSTVFSGKIQDQGPFPSDTGGSLTKIGRGTLALSGANTYTGNTNVDGGVLQVDGSIVSPNTFVNPGGTLSGTGTVGGNLSNGGIVSPGDSPGTLHVGGNFSQGSGGTLEIEIASLFSFDQLMVSGTASLGGTLDVSLEGYTGHAGDMFTILSSSGLSGNFVNFDLPELSNGLFFTESVTSNDVLLTVNGSTGVPDEGATLWLMASALAALFGMQHSIISRLRQPSHSRTEIQHQ